MVAAGLAAGRLASRWGATRRRLRREPSPPRARGAVAGCRGWPLVLVAVVVGRMVGVAEHPTPPRPAPRPRRRRPASSQGARRSLRAPGTRVTAGRLQWVSFDPQWCSDVVPPSSGLVHDARRRPGRGGGGWTAGVRGRLGRVRWTTVTWWPSSSRVPRPPPTRSPAAEALVDPTVLVGRPRRSPAWPASGGRPATVTAASPSGRSRGADRPPVRSGSPG